MDADLIVAAPKQVRQQLRCDGGRYFGVVINNRWLEMTCRDKRCKRDGVLTVHVWDLLTGWKSTEYRPIDSDGA